MSWMYKLKSVKLRICKKFVLTFLPAAATDIAAKPDNFCVYLC